MDKGEWPDYSVLELQSAGHLLVEDGNHGEYRPRQEEFGSGDTAFIRAADMDNGRLLFEVASKINAKARDRITKGIGKGGDILLSHKGTVGKLSIAPIDAPPFVCSPQTTFWRTLNESKIDRRYLYYFMRSDKFREQLDARKGETDMADYVSLTAQRELRVVLPGIVVQRAIARILGILDDKIELNRKLNQTLEGLARALFKSWFVDFDPVVSKAARKKPVGMSAETAALFPDSFVESELGPIPNGWRTASIADIAEYINGRNFTKNATGAGRMVIRIAELNSGPAGSTVYYHVDASNENIAYPGDILFSWSGSLDVYRWHRDEALINQHIFKVICHDNPQWFAYYNLREALPFFQGIAAGKATTMGHIKREHLSQAKLVLPTGRLLDHASRLIQPLYDKIHRLERHSMMLATLRDALLPKLMSGELRVKGAERRVAAAV